MPLYLLKQVFCSVEKKLGTIGFWVLDREKMTGLCVDQEKEGKIVLGGFLCAIIWPGIKNAGAGLMDRMIYLNSKN
jgi:hypothetical protein